VTIEAIVTSAIHGRAPLLFRYEGDELPERLGHPHALFLEVSQGAACVDVWQVGGFTRTGALPTWRTFFLDKIVTAEKLESSFDLAPGWDPLGDKYAGGMVAMV
jgi:hypothetical protein